jgi:murein DD-endopeptidase MepM/ murein hydrolase activator NlpD
VRSFAIVALIVACGCASVPDAPEPVVLTGGPEVSPDRTPAASAVEPVFAAPASGPPLPTLPLSIRISPDRPRQASVVSIRIGEPPGPPLEQPSVRVAGRDVTLLRRGSAWIGLAGLPVDSSGLFEVEVTGRRGNRLETELRVIRVGYREYPATRIGISAGDRSDPEVDARIAREQQLIRSRLASSANEWLPEGPFDWPRPPIRTSPFGQRRVFNGQVRSRHMGLDLRGRRGQGTYAPAAGRVLLTGRFFYQGNAVYLDHGLGLVTAYFHFSSIEVEEGEVVQPGHLLGRVGSTGRSTAPHLHWSAYVHGASVDPESLIGFQLSPVEGMTGNAETLFQKR